MGRKRQEKALEDALTRALATGIKLGQQQAFERSLIATAESVLHREFTDISSVVAASGTQEALRFAGIAARGTWPTRWREALRGPLSAVMQAATESKAAVLGSFNLASPKMAEFLEGYTSKLGETLSSTSFDKFEAALKEAMDSGLSIPDTRNLLQERIPKLNRGRAELIARTETHTAASGANFEQARTSGVVKTKVWQSAGDNRVRPEHRILHGSKVPIDKPFANGLMYPSEPRCRCVLTYEIDHEALQGRVA